jgi:acyl-coenzyme A synthetase/AMP-(fatty) acid ligase
VENALFAHEAVSEASVVGLPDERYGECVAAFVVVHQHVRGGKVAAGEGDEGLDVDGGGKDGKGKVLTKEGVREWVRSQLSNHMAPKYVFWVKEYPKTASGKIQKFKLRDLGLQLLKDVEGNS